MKKWTILVIIVIIAILLVFKKENKSNFVVNETPVDSLEAIKIPNDIVVTETPEGVFIPYGSDELSE